MVERMNDSTRSPESQQPQHDAASENPTAGEGRESTGTGWSSPTSSTPSSPDAGATPDPWAARPNDTGVIPRPTDTQALVAQQAAGSVPPTGESVPPTDGSVPPAGPTVPPPGGPAAGTFAPQSAPSAGPANRSRRSTALVVALALGAGLLGGAAGAGVVNALDDDSPAPASSLDREPSDGDPVADLSSVEEVAETLSPSVVSIGIDSPQGQGGGSGVIISSDGQILTNNHVAEAGEGGTLTITFHDGTTAEAEILGLDASTDLAVIQAQDVSGLQAADFGDSDQLRVGEQVVAFGSPLGLDGTVTSGIVSALNRPVTASDQQGGTASSINAIQTDAPINPGNSGGPLVNMAGQVVGINSAIATSFGSDGSIGLGFAIPINQAQAIADQLIETGSASTARIGIEVKPAPPDTPGALVNGIESGTAAADTELAEGDIITRIDDHLVTDPESLIAFTRSYRPGDTVTLTYLRDGEEHTLDIVLGSSDPST
jgi:putative serine protease PepD